MQNKDKYSKTSPEKILRGKAALKARGIPPTPVNKPKMKKERK